MPKKKKVIEPKIEKKAEEPRTPVVKELKEFSVYNAQGDFIRTYSVEIHGEKAGELAQGYAEKIGGIIK